MQPVILAPNAEEGDPAVGRAVVQPGVRRAQSMAPRRVEKPKTAAQLRSAEVKAERGVREPPAGRAAAMEREQWIDDGPIRSAARGAAAHEATRRERTGSVAASSNGAGSCA